MADTLNNAPTGGESKAGNGNTVTEPQNNNLSGQDNTQDGQKQDTQTHKLYTESEFTAEMDKRLREAQTKWTAELDNKLNAARSEGEKLAKMNAEERAKAQFDTDKAKFEDERAKYEAERLEFEATKLLSENKLPVSFAKMCVGGDAESTKANIEAFKNAWSEALQDAVNERMRGTTPKTGGANSTPAATGFIDAINEFHR